LKLVDTLICFWLFKKKFVSLQFEILIKITLLYSHYYIPHYYNSLKLHTINKLKLNMIYFMPKNLIFKKKYKIFLQNVFLKIFLMTIFLDQITQL